MIDIEFKKLDIRGEKVSKIVVVNTPPQKGKVYCSTCIHLSPTETEQDDVNHKLYGCSHRCKVLDIRLLHMGKHPLIPKPDFCYLHKIKKEN